MDYSRGACREPGHFIDGLGALMYRNLRQVWRLYSMFINFITGDTWEDVCWYFLLMTRFKTPQKARAVERVNGDKLM